MSAKRVLRKRVRILEQEVKSLKILAVSQGAVNLVLCQLLVQRGAIRPEDASLVSAAYRDPGPDLTPEQIMEWARTQFSSATRPGCDAEREE